MPSEKEVCVLYACVRGFLDKIATSDIGKFEKLYLEDFKSSQANILETIRAKY